MKREYTQYTHLSLSSEEEACLFGWKHPSKSQKAIDNHLKETEMVDAMSFIPDASACGDETYPERERGQPDPPKDNTETNRELVRVFPWNSSN
jgi:hypothetical protein